MTAIKCEIVNASFCGFMFMFYLTTGKRQRGAATMWRGAGCHNLEWCIQEGWVQAFGAKGSHYDW